MKNLRKSVSVFLFFILLSFTMACNTERRDDQGEYSEGDNEIIQEDSVNNEENEY